MPMTPIERQTATFIVAADGSGDYNDIQTAINALTNGGLIVVKQGTYVLADTLWVKQKVTLAGEGIDSTILQLGNNVQKSVVELDDDAALYGLTVDGNQANNRSGEGGWTSVEDVPFAEGVSSALYWNNSETTSASNYCHVENVKITNTLRTGLKIIGAYGTFRNLTIDSSYTDHHIYMLSGASGTTTCEHNLIENVNITGSANAECITIGSDSNYTANRNVIRNISTYSLTAGKWGATYNGNGDGPPELVVHIRSDAGKYNRIQNIHVENTGNVWGSSIRLGDDHNELSDVRIRTKFYALSSGLTYMLSVAGDHCTLNNIHLENTTTGLAASQYIMQIYGNGVQGDNIYIDGDSASTFDRGLYVQGGTAEIKSCALNNLKISVKSNNTTLTLDGATNPVSFTGTNVYFEDSQNFFKTGSVRANMSHALRYHTPEEVVYVKNSSGGTVSAGDVVVVKAVAAGNEITTTTTQGDDLVLGMVVETIGNTGWGYVQTRGKTNLLKVNGTTDIAIGDFIGTFTTAKIGMKAAAGDMAFAIALEAYTTDDSAGVIDALLITPRKI